LAARLLQSRPINVTFSQCHSLHPWRSSEKLVSYCNIKWHHNPKTLTWIFTTMRTSILDYISVQSQNTSVQKISVLFVPAILDTLLKYYFNILGIIKKISDIHRLFNTIFFTDATRPIKWRKEMLNKW
jgi:hypothetical protein